MVRAPVARLRGKGSAAGDKLQKAAMGLLMTPVGGNLLVVDWHVVELHGQLYSFFFWEHDLFAPPVMSQAAALPL